MLLVPAMPPPTTASGTHNLHRSVLPCSYYGAEQGMQGGLENSANRGALWEHGGYGVSHPLYAFIRTLAWYRWWMRLGTQPFQGGPPRAPLLAAPGAAAPNGP